MTDITYEIVEHDGGWAYKLGAGFSETFASRDEAVNAAKRVAAEQQVPGETEPILYQDESGEWREEVAQGGDRPVTHVKE